MGIPLEGRPYTGASEVLAEELMQGDVVRLIRELDPSNPGARVEQEAAVFVQIKRDKDMDVVVVSGRDFGVQVTTPLANYGLRPHEDEEEGLRWWDPVYHTQSLGVNIPLNRGQGPSRLLNSDVISADFTKDPLSVSDLAYAGLYAYMLDPHSAIRTRHMPVPDSVLQFVSA